MVCVELVGKSGRGVGISALIEQQLDEFFISPFSGQAEGRLVEPVARIGPILEERDCEFLQSLGNHPTYQHVLAGFLHVGAIL